jgi:thiol-disulfide isomerase/thioredoxin
MSKGIWVVVAIVVVAIIGVLVSGGSDKDMMADKMMKEGVGSKDMASTSAPADKMMKDEGTTSVKGDTMMKSGSYVAYSPEKIAMADQGKVVIFFHASWCPSCRLLSNNLESDAKAIPEGVTILKADYDKETELKKKYGVTGQHTLVQVDKDGNMIKKWRGGSDIQDVMSEIK